MREKPKHCRPVYNLDAFLAGPNPAGKASNYISHAERDIRHGDDLILWCRESHRSQKANLDDQVENLRRVAGELGANVAYVFRHVGSGKAGFARLLKAFAEAKKRGAKLVAESTSRFIRPPDFHPQTNPDAQATEDDLQFLSPSASN